MSLNALLVNSEVPRPIRAAFTRAPRSEIGEEDLWRSVVARAVLDAIGQVSPTGLSVRRPGSAPQRCVEVARQWFQGRSPWFVTACHLGSLDGQLIRALVLAEVKRLDNEDRALYALFATLPFMGETSNERAHS